MIGTESSEVVYDVVVVGAGAAFEVPVRENTDVLQVAKVGDGFRIDTADETLQARHVIWAAGRSVGRVPQPGHVSR